MPPKTEVASKATFGVDDKRAQYARLVVFNHGVQEKIISKDKDVNTATNAELEKAGKSLVGGNLLDGKDGVVLIQKLSKNGSTTGRELTTAYAQEVRPFLKRLRLSDGFGHRGKKADGEKAPAKPKAAGKAKATPKPKAKPKATPTPEPAATEAA